MLNNVLKYSIFKIFRLYIIWLSIGEIIVIVNSVNKIGQIQPSANEKVKENNQNKTTEKQINEISNICYKPISFGRTLAEHKSWGAVIDPKTKEASFKIFTYPDTKKVTVTVKKRNKKQEKTYELINKGNGIFETAKKIPSDEVQNGDKYFYTIYKGNGDTDKVKDPYSFRQEQLLGESVIYDHSLFNWTDDKWFKNNKNRISRKANYENGLKPVSSARIYEFNPATFTQKGTFKSAKSMLNSVKDMGFNAIEIMPVENTFSFNWGYDGVDKFAPSEHLGGPDELKSLIDYAHNIGLNVIMDMVPNHLGPDGASLLKTGPYIKGSNDFGEAFNFEGQNSKYVRDYMVNAALNWIDNYHCDGLRLDMTKYMESDYTMKQIAAEINYHKPDAFLIAEDGRGNDYRVTAPLEKFESEEGNNEQNHCRAIENIENNNTPLDKLGFNSEWDFYFYHTLNECLYGNVDLDNLENALYSGSSRVKYVMSHDEIGNFEGSRLISKLLVPMLNLNENIQLNYRDIQRAKDLSKAKQISEEEATHIVKSQKAQLASEQLAIFLQTGYLDDYKTNIQGISSQKKRAIQKAFESDVLTPLGIRKDSGITVEALNQIYKKAYDKYKMVLARTYATPGQKMVFQGDEKADLTPFRFFREFQSVPDEHYLYVEKGYDTGLKGFIESKLGTLKYSSEGKDNISKFKNLTRDLNRINEENPALSDGYIVRENTVKHPVSKVLGTHMKAKNADNEIFAITNFMDAEYPRLDASSYFINFPKGKWKEILNTDSTHYDGSGAFKNNQVIISDGQNKNPIKMAAYSTLIFKKVG